MQQHDRRTSNSEERPSDSRRQVRSEFPEPVRHLPRERHPDWPSELECLDVRAYRTAAVLVEALEPLSNGLPPRIEAEEHYVHCLIRGHGRKAPLLVRASRARYCKMPLPGDAGSTSWHRSGPELRWSDASVNGDSGDVRRPLARCRIRRPPSALEAPASDSGSVRNHRFTPSVRVNRRPSMDPRAHARRRPRRPAR